MKKASQMAPQMYPRRRKIGSKSRSRQGGGPGEPKWSQDGSKNHENRAKIDAKIKSAKAEKLNKNKEKHSN